MSSRENEIDELIVQTYLKRKIGALQPLGPFNNHSLFCPFLVFVVL